MAFVMSATVSGLTLKPQASQLRKNVRCKVRDDGPLDEEVDVVPRLLVRGDALALEPAAPLDELVRHLPADDLELGLLAAHFDASETRPGNAIVGVHVADVRAAHDSASHAEDQHLLVIATVQIAQQLVRFAVDLGDLDTAGAHEVEDASVIADSFPGADGIEDVTSRAQQGVATHLFGVLPTGLVVVADEGLLVNGLATLGVREELVACRKSGLAVGEERDAIAGASDRAGLAVEDALEFRGADAQGGVGLKDASACTKRADPVRHDDDARTAIQIHASDAGP